MLRFLFFILLLYNQIIFAQKIENVNFKQKNDSVFEIYYDINNSNKQQTFIVRLHYTIDRGKHYSDSLKFVSGDIGKNIKGGKGKKIIWESYKESKIKFGKKIMFDVRARICTDPLISNVISKVKQKSDSIFEIYYDLNNSNIEQLFSVFLSYSIDGGIHYIDSLIFVKGDIGVGIKGGKKKKIIWEAFKEKKIIDYKNIMFDVKAKIVSNPKPDEKFGNFVDPRDGKTYKTVIIENRTWLAENLNYYSKTGSKCYNDSNANCSKYGRLYDWETALKVCPKGWHLPSDEELSCLFVYEGDDKTAGKKLKKNGTSYGTNRSGFSGLYGGMYGQSGIFKNIGISGFWWSSFNLKGIEARALGILNGNDGTVNMRLKKTDGISVRCVKD